MSGRGNQATAEVIQQAALELFAKRGFEATRVDDIAVAAGIGRRTFFHYYASKNDIPFGDMDPLLSAMDDWLMAVPDEVPVLEALATAVVRFNTVHTDGVAAHRWRMSLIHRTPALQAHRTLRSARWQAVIAGFAARRLGQPAEALGPQFIAQLTVGATVAAYDVWLSDPDADLEALMRRPFSMIELGPGLGQEDPSPAG